MALFCVALAIVLGLALGAGWWCFKPRRKARGRLGTWEDVRIRARQGGYRLIDTAALAELYRENLNGLLLVDTRPQAGYRESHIKGAVSFPLAPTWWARWSCRKVLAALLGPDKDRLLVFY